MNYSFYLLKNHEQLNIFITASIAENTIKYELIENFRFNHPLDDPSYSCVSAVIEDLDDYECDLNQENKARFEEFLRKTWLVSSTYGLGNFLNEEQENLAKQTEPSFFSIIDYDCAKYLIKLFNKIDFVDLESKYSSSMEYAYEHFEKDLKDWADILQQVKQGEFFMIFMG